jgi:two-component system cell cycle sensor histidine kinase/response regulator CckA
VLASGGTPVIEPRVLDLNACITGVMGILLRLIGADIELVTSLDPTLGHVLADHGQIEQILVNLAVHARDTMPNGGRLTIETANVVLDDRSSELHLGSSPGPYVMLTVRDSGIGLDPEILAHIFEPSFSSGLGLATVHGIVKQSGGFIEAESTQGLGTMMRVYLPLSVPFAVPETPEPEDSNTAGAVTILLVEDEDAVRVLTRRILMRAGYTVLAARNADEALATSQAHPGAIDLLLTDVIMPGASGARLAGVLQPIRPEMDVLFMSGYAEDTMVRQGVLTPGVAYLQKPFTPTSLARKVREVLDARSARAEKNRRAAG